MIDDNFERETYLDSGIKLAIVDNKLESYEVDKDLQTDLVKTITFDSLDIRHTEKQQEVTEV